MIANNDELECTQERIAYFYKIVGQIRAQARTPKEYQLYSNSYLAEIEKMNQEVLEYLKQYPGEMSPAEAA